MFVLFLHFLPATVETGNGNLRASCMLIEGPRHPGAAATGERT